MKYNGKLYGKIGKKYFDTGNTGDDWEMLEIARSALAELYEAMIRYEGDVDGEAPSEHHRMMDRVRAALSSERSR